MRTLPLLAVLLLSSPAVAAEVGRPAPDFTLRDLDGHAVRLSDHRGKIVVLEWFNPGCPFVVA
jgi:peroxiredoxin